VKTRRPTDAPSIATRLLILLFLAGLAAGCGISGADIERFAKKEIGSLSGGENDPKKKKMETLNPKEIQSYYDKFNKSVAGRMSFRTGTKDIVALDVMPKDTSGEVNWTAAVTMGIIDPASSIDLDIIDEPPFDLNIFIEAKVPLMANVLFPHSIHTYWLKCSNCHPGIFLPQVGANDMKMSEIFEGKWCGRCHGKVAFTFWPRANCARCHIIPKGQSLSKERWQ
jgi:c(7)-type cytochrome triheme protein